MNDWRYTIKVCPFDGAQVREEGGWDGTELVFDCEHESWMEEYGSIDPIEVAVDPVGQGIPGNPLDEALKAAATRLEEQRQERAAEKAERERKETERRAALTAEQREAEDRQRAIENAAMKQIVYALTPEASPLTIFTQRLRNR